jgi:hypothetical protein
LAGCKAKQSDRPLRRAKEAAVEGFLKLGGLKKVMNE